MTPPAGPVPIPVKVARLRQSEAPSVVAVRGSAVSPESPANVAFLVSGRVATVGPREGDYVKRGQALAAVDPTDYLIALDAAVAQVQPARALLQKAESPARPEVLEQARVAFDRAQDALSAERVDCDVHSSSEEGTRNDSDYDM